MKFKINVLHLYAVVPCIPCVDLKLLRPLLVVEILWCFPCAGSQWIPFNSVSEVLMTILKTLRHGSGNAVFAGTSEARVKGKPEGGEGGVWEMDFSQEQQQKTNQRQTSSDVKPGRAGLVLGRVTTFKPNRIIFYILSKSCFSHCHSFFSSAKTGEAYIF